MGLFSNIFSLSGAKELNQAANAVVHVRMLLDEYERGNDFDFLCAAAWIAQVGFLDVVERNNWPMHYSLVAIINGHPTRMTIAEAMLQTSTRIMTKAQHLTSKELKFI